MFGCNEYPLTTMHFCLRNKLAKCAQTTLVNGNSLIEVRQLKTRCSISNQQLLFFNKKSQIAWHCTPLYNRCFIDEPIFSNWYILCLNDGCVRQPYMFVKRSTSYFESLLITRLPDLVLM